MKKFFCVRNRKKGIRDKDVLACFVIARSFELGACKLAPRDARRAGIEMAARASAFPLPLSV